jgi:hypothetical protein
MFTLPRTLTVQSARAKPKAPRAPPPQNPWTRQGKKEVFIDPRNDEDLKELLEGYEIENKSLEYPLSVRIDQYKSEDDSYPRKYVSMFVLNTEKGKIVSPTLNALMDKLDQQQLKLKDKDNLETPYALYANDKVLEFQYLKGQYKKLTKDQKERYSELKKTLREISPIPEEEPEENIPNATLANALRQSEAALTQAKTLTQTRKQQNEEHAEIESLTNRIARLTGKAPTPSPSGSLPFNLSTDPQLAALRAKVAATLKAATPPDPNALPDGWTEHVDDASGKTYYHRASNDTTQWDRPTAGGKYRRRTRHRRARNNKTRRNKTRKH